MPATVTVTVTGLTETTRILVASDIAGNETVWRKLVNAISLDVYKIDAALVAGGLGVDAEQARAWVELAAERLAGVEIPLCLIPGAQDESEIDIELTAPQRNPVNVDGRAHPLPGGLTLISDSCRPGSIAERLQTLAAGAPPPLVLMTSAPPYDDAIAVGSREVARAVRRVAPALSVHGLGGTDEEDRPDPKRFIGDTLALTPGSEAAQEDRLLGFVVDLIGGGVQVARPLET